MCESTRSLAQQKLRRRFAVCSMLLVFIFGCIEVHAQATQGSVIGTARDPNGAVVAGAAVTLTNTDEGTQRTTRTNTVGDYQFLDVKAGKYQVEIQTTGFKKWQAVGVTLAVRQELRLDAKLEVGAVQQEIEVTGENVSAIRRNRRPSALHLRRPMPTACR